MVAERPLKIRLLEIISVAGFAAASSTLAVRLWSVPWEPSQLAPMCAGALLGFLVADVVSGIVHWFCDTFFHDDTPVIGRAFIHPFREHHVDPLAITRHGFFEVNGNNCLALVPLVTAVLILGKPGEGQALPALFLQSAAFGFAVATFATNQIHKWAHQERPALPVHWLQASGLILSPAHHDRHHCAPHRQAFCITFGWLDPLLDSTRIFERIEHAVRRDSASSGRGDGSSVNASAVSRRLPASRVAKG